MATGHCGTDHVCSVHFRALLVGGFMASRNEVEEAAWELCKRLFDYSERQRRRYYRKVHSIVNSARHLGEVPSRDVEQIMKFIAEADPCEDGITTAVFAHSHGAKLARGALQAETFTQFIQTNFDYAKEEKARNRLKAVRGNLAVITLGAITMLPEDLAKVVVNIRLAQDLKSFMGEKIFGDSHDKKVDILVIGSKDDMPTASRSWWTPVMDYFKGKFTSTGGSQQGNHAGLKSDGQDVVPTLTASKAVDATRTTPSDRTTQDEELTVANAGITSADNVKKEKLSFPLSSRESHGSWMYPFKVASTGGVRHVLDEYMLDEETMAYVISRLSLDKNVKCACVFKGSNVSSIGSDSEGLFDRHSHMLILTE